MKTVKYSILLLLIGCLASTGFSQRKKKKQDTPPVVETPKPKKSKFKKYSDIVTSEFKTDEGLFKVHRSADKFLYEIPHSMLGTEMLWVTRISELPEGFGGGYTNAGSKTNEQVIQWERAGDKIYLRSISYTSVADASLPISKSVEANTYDPIIGGFDIKTFSSDSSAVVIDVSKFFSSEITALSPINTFTRSRHKIKRFDGTRSYVNEIRSYPENVEVKQVMTWVADAPPSNRRSGTITLGVNQSMILLPEEKMIPRFYDPRVGWFTVSQIDFGSDELKADQKSYVRRWKLIPKDIEAYKRGELVEPVKPIVYYIDPATPEKWRKYIKQGVNDWQKPFESAGFKNAIYAKDPPTAEEDPDFSPEDIRYSVIRYVASTTRNATGPSVSDPRTGEIIESDIIWYHNHLRSYRNRYMIETGAANPDARTLNLDDDVIGETLRMVIAHEVGHTLGLPHNMKGSYAYPVESLRSGEFTQEFGIAASIMDYARFNYVAQPGDEGIRFVRQMGPYDHYSVNWGYRYIDGADTPEAQREVTTKWVEEKYGDPKYEFGSGRGADPASQTECIGDDPVKASSYGISNLKRVVPKLPEWTSSSTNNYADLREVYQELVGIWGRYIGHVVTNVGGVHETLRNPDQPGTTYKVVAKDVQKESVDWLNKNAFATQDWLMDKSIVYQIYNQGYSDRITRTQGIYLRNLLSGSRIARMMEQESVGESTYTAMELMNDVRLSLWSELNSRQAISHQRRALQRVYIEHLTSIIQSDENTAKYSDLPAMARGQLVTLRQAISRSRTSFRDTVSRNHLDDIISRIDEGLKAD